MNDMDVDADRLRRRALRVWYLVGLVVLVWVVWEVAGPILAIVIPPIVLAVIIVYLLNPIVGAIGRRHVHRIFGTVLAYVLVAAFIAVPAIVGLPLLSEQATSIWEQAPATVNDLIVDAETWLASRGVDVELSSQFDAESLPAFETFVNSEGRSVIAAVLGGLSGLASGLFRLLLVSLLGPIIAFYVLVDLPRLRQWTIRHLPPHHRVETVVVGRDLSGVIGGYIRGQLLVALFVGSAVTFGMWLIDLPYWLVVGIIAGLTNLVPLLGPFVAGVIGGAIALADGGLPMALLVIAVLTVVQQVDNHMISPLVMGQTVHLHPLAVLFALLVGSTLYGFLGLLMAVPSVAAGRVILAHVWATRVPWAATGDDEILDTPIDTTTLDTGPVGGAVAGRSERSARRSPADTA